MPPCHDCHALCSGLGRCSVCRAPVCAKCAMFKDHRVYCHEHAPRDSDDSRAYVDKQLSEYVDDLNPYPKGYKPENN